MARILAIDTTAELGSAALIEDDRVVDEVSLRAPDGFSPVIFGVIQELLQRHGWTLGSLDCFAGASGPGSFTGVRVCLTAIKGLAEATGKPAIAVSNLQALGLHATGNVRAVWIDARRGEIYGGVFDSGLQPLTEEVVAPMEKWRDSLPPAATILQGGEIPLAGAVGRIAMQRYRSGDRPDPATLDANYVRYSDAELFWKDASRTSGLSSAKPMLPTPGCSA
jgi:tRNA threonylcarbamoyladenosine biosynthesis protein TsaB